MTVTIMTKKHPYVFPDADGFQIELEDEDLAMDAVMEDGKQIVRVGDWSDVQ